MVATPVSLVLFDLIQRFVQLFDKILQISPMLTYLYVFCLERRLGQP
jgi:hypothetical protein